MTKIVVVEDDTYLRDEIILTFQRKGYSALGISSFAAAEQEILALSPDLVILDVNLPVKSGYELCRWLKGRSSFPVLILTARDSLSDELTSLGLGADDFLTKPCHPDRLLARAERLLQTYNKIKNIIQIQHILLDTDNFKLTNHNVSVLLPETEGKILRLLMERHPNVVSKTELVAYVWGSKEFVDENILQVNITRLRKNLAEIGLTDLLQNVRGQGYCLKVAQNEIQL